MAQCSLSGDPASIARSLVGQADVLDTVARQPPASHVKCPQAPPSTNQTSECLPVTPMRNDLSAGLNLHFAYYGCSQASLRMFKDHLCIFLCELSVHVFCQFFYLIFFFLFPFLNVLSILRRLALYL